MPIRILFIENQQYDMEEYAEIFREGYEITRAYDVLQARDYVSDNKLLNYDIVVLDIMMPPMNLYTSAESNNGLLTGISFFKGLLSDKPEKNSPISVILLTGATGKTYEAVQRLKQDHPRQVISVLRKSDADPLVLKRVIEEWNKDRQQKGRLYADS